jgi:hypothetical protein
LRSCLRILGLLGTAARLVRAFPVFDCPSPICPDGRGKSWVFDGLPNDCGFCLRLRVVDRRRCCADLRTRVKLREGLASVPAQVGMR